MSYSIDLSGRVALITGASSGLGEQFARTLAKAGAAVVLAGRRVERLKTLRSEIEALGGDAHVVGLDVTDTHSIRSAIAHAETEVGAIDILVNNSGVSTTQKLVDVTPEDSTTSSTPTPGVPSSWPRKWASACWRGLAVRPPAPTPAGASSILRRWPACVCWVRSACIA
jgi:NAD(P)-dependent dehydrogenase (short-subunit alcohol dehydrogenase family)